MSPAPALPRWPRGERGVASGELARLVAISTFSHSVGCPFTKPYFISKVYEYLLRAGIPTAGFSGHSLQTGAAVSATAKGLSKDEIKFFSRWKSDAVNLYINDIFQSALASHLMALNSRLLLVSSLSSPASQPRPPLSHFLPLSPLWHSPRMSRSLPSMPAHRLAGRD